jgi:hypothetical protein
MKAHWGPKWNDPKISEALGTYPMMCARVRQQFAQGGMDAVLNRKQRVTPPVPRIFDGEKEARLIALACWRCQAAKNPCKGPN